MLQWYPQETKNDKVAFQVSVDVTVKENLCFMIQYKSFRLITTLCIETAGPPLDVLRRPAQLFNATHGHKGGGNANVNNQERRTKWWVCIVEGRIIFYQYFGDTVPRYVASLSDATASPPKQQSNLTVLTLGDGRKWLFDFEERKQVNRFVFCVNETKRACDGNSIYFKKRIEFDESFNDK